MSEVKKKSKGFKVRYATAGGGGIVVTLPFDPRKGVCDACGKSKENGEIKTTALHHWWYAYQAKTVRENPLLALENTSELCFYCHGIGDSIRALLYAHPERVADVARLLKGEQRAKFVNVLKAIVDEMERTEKNISPLANKLVDLARKNTSEQ